MATSELMLKTVLPTVVMVISFSLVMLSLRQSNEISSQVIVKLNDLHTSAIVKDSCNNDCEETIKSVFEGNKAWKQALCDSSAESPVLHKGSSSISFVQCVAEMSKYPCCVYESAGHNCCGDKWNEEIRYYPMKIDSNSVWVELGGNEGQDAGTFVNKYNPKKYYVFEPVPSYIKKLETKFAGKSNVHVMGYGLGIEDKEVVFKGNTAGLGEFTGDSDSGIKVLIKDVHKVGKQLDFASVDVFHMNCEGCEWNFLEALIEENWLANAKYIQIGTHRLGATAENLNLRYCRIAEKLSETHIRVDWKPWAWERWIRKDIA